MRDGVRARPRVSTDLKHQSRGADRAARVFEPFLPDSNRSLNKKASLNPPPYLRYCKSTRVCAHCRADPSAAFGGVRCTTSIGISYGNFCDCDHIPFGSAPRSSFCEQTWPNGGQSHRTTQGDSHEHQSRNDWNSHPQYTCFRNELRVCRTA